jgi:hypothetical protein
MYSRMACLRRLLRQQVPQREIVHYILHVLDPVLEPIAAAAQAVVLEVEDLESRKQVLDKLVDENGTLIVTERDGVAGKARLGLLACRRLPRFGFTYQLFDQRDERLQVLLECEVELVALLEVDGNCSS